MIIVDTNFSNSSHNNNYRIIKYFVPASVITINPYGRVSNMLGFLPALINEWEL